MHIKDIFSISLLFFFPTVLYGQIIHVSKDGKDTNIGTAAHPVASLEKARQMIRERKSYYTSVWIHQGTYDLSRTFSFGPEDGGTTKNPIIWQAAPGEKVSITGALTVEGRKIQKVTNDAILNRLPKEARTHVYQIDLFKEGIKDFGTFQQYGHGLPVVPAPLELLFNEAPMTLARYPNQGALKIGKVIDKGSVPRTGDKSNRGAQFQYTNDRHKRWVGLTDVWIQGTLNYGFADDCNPVASIDSVRGLVTLAKPHLYGVASGRDFQEYVALNILEELDEAGEWYLDRRTGLLYFWPPANLIGARIQLTMLEDPIIAFEGIQHLQFKNITIEAGRGIGIYIEKSAYILIAGCTVRNLGTSGIFMGQGAISSDANSSIDDYSGTPQSRQIGSYQNQMYANTTWNRQAGHHIGILSCDVYNTGSGGICLSGGDKKTLQAGNNYVENCKIFNYTRRNKFTWAGIRVDGCGNTVRHNEISQSDWHGIFVMGNDHVFEYNYIHDVTLNSDDTSPWYIGRNPSDRGNIVRFNFFDRCGNRNRMNMGIYCDDSSGDVFVFGNVFNDMRTEHGVLFSNTGWHLVMKNNIIINPMSHTAVNSAHYYTWAAGIAKDMFGEKGLIRKRLEKEIDFRSSPYAERYPSLLPYLDVIVENKEWEGMRSRGNIVEQNLIVGGPEEPVKLMGGMYAQTDVRNNWVTREDPGFIDSAHKNFGLRRDAKVFEKIPGFQPIPFDKMGLYKDGYRK